MIVQIILSLKEIESGDNYENLNLLKVKQIFFKNIFILRVDIDKN